jgi:hypothetical protein
MSTTSKLQALDLVILYDVLQAGQRAKELCDRLAGQAGDTYAMRFHCWNFAMLDDPVVVEIVTLQILSAPCLIVAFNGNDNLARPAEVFLRQAARTMRAAGTALVAQLHGIPNGTEQQLPAFRCLQRIAANAGIPFFFEVIKPAADAAYSAYRLESRKMNELAYAELSE